LLSSSYWPLAELPQRREAVRFYRYVIAPEIRGGADVISPILDRSPEHSQAV
jgi:hypothetical protein